MKITLDKNTEYIINTLNNAGFEAFAVGGYVRDKLMGREVTDCDITTSAKPMETKKIFADHKVIETGIKHGTVTVFIHNTPYEITTYRTEKGYSDSRHPDKVFFVTNLRDDLSRRDFTVNAIAFNPQHGIEDPFFGINDINNKVIRAVGDPYKRFSEDALRILRALRFASVLGFKIEPQTAKAIHELSESISKVSPERIYAELQKLFLGINASNVITEYSDVLSILSPISSNFHNISRLPLDFAMRFYAVFGDNSIGALNSLRADNETKQRCALLMNSTPIPKDSIQLKLYASAMGREAAEYIARYRRCVYGEDADFQIEKILSQNSCLSVSELSVNGNDLVNIGIKGKHIGEALNKLLNLVIVGEIENSKEQLLNWVKNNTVS